MDMAVDSNVEEFYQEIHDKKKNGILDFGRNGNSASYWYRLYDISSVILDAASVFPRYTAV